MASWSETTKHEPSSINGGQRYDKGDRVSREQLNLITENSFYAVNKSNAANVNSENALSVANKAFDQSKVTGTQVTVGGVFQPTFDADTKVDKSELLDKTYPVGSVYLSRDSADPAGKFGGSWEELDADRTLWITSSTTTINNENKNIAAGLPNIIGRIETSYSSGYNGLILNAYDSFNVSGASFKYGMGTSGGVSQTTYNNVEFNADNGATSKGIYRDDCTTVQPSATRVYGWIRTA